MGAVWRAASRKWPLSRAANCSGSFVARGLNRLAAKSLIWPHILVKLTGAERPRGRYGTHARFTVAERAMDKCLHLQRCAVRYGGRIGYELSVLVCHSLAQGSCCTRRIGGKILLCAFPLAAHLQ